MKISQRVLLFFSFLSPTPTLLAAGIVMWFRNIRFLFITWNKKKANQRIFQQENKIENCTCSGHVIYFIMLLITFCNGSIATLLRIKGSFFYHLVLYYTVENSFMMKIKNENCYLNLFLSNHTWYQNSLTKWSRKVQYLFDEILEIPQYDRPVTEEVQLQDNFKLPSMIKLSPLILLRNWKHWKKFKCL